MSDELAGGGRGDDPPEPDRPPPALLPLDAHTHYRYTPDDVELVVLHTWGHQARQTFVDVETRVQKALLHGDHDAAMELRHDAARHMAQLQDLNVLLRRRGADAIAAPMVVIL